MLYRQLKCWIDELLINDLLWKYKDPSCVISDFWLLNFLESSGRQFFSAWRRSHYCLKHQVPLNYIYKIKRNGRSTLYMEKKSYVILLMKTRTPFTWKCIWIATCLKIVEVPVHCAGSELRTELEKFITDQVHQVNYIGKLMKKDVEFIHLNKVFSSKYNSLILTNIS